MDGSQKIIEFPRNGAKSRSMQRLVRRSSSLPGFRVVTGEVDPVTDLTRERVSEALGLDWSAPLVIETDDPTAQGKRDFNLRFLAHDGVRWKV